MQDNNTAITGLIFIACIGAFVLIYFVLPKLISRGFERGSAAIGRRLAPEKYAAANQLLETATIIKTRVAPLSLFVHIMVLTGTRKGEPGPRAELFSRALSNQGFDITLGDTFGHIFIVVTETIETQPVFVYRVECVSARMAQGVPQAHQKLAAVLAAPVQAAREMDPSCEITVIPAGPSNRSWESGPTIII